MINKIFTKQIGQNVEACIDDIIVKSEKANMYMKYLEEVLCMLKKI